MVSLFENFTDAYKKSAERTKQFFLTVPIFVALYALHTLLPSYASARALTFLSFNLVMTLITLDLMLCTMAAKPFMACHPALLLLLLSPAAYFGFGVPPQVEVYISAVCGALAFGLYSLRMVILTIQYYDYA